MRFMNGLPNFVGFFQDPKGLKIHVETLGFGHLHLEVTVPRVVIFRDAIMDLFALELGSRFEPAAENGALSWLWDNVERILQTNIGKPIRCERHHVKLLATFDDQNDFGLQAAIYATFFEQCQTGQDFLEQSNVYLHVIASVVIDITIGFCRTPAKVVDDISALGLSSTDGCKLAPQHPIR